MAKGNIVKNYVYANVAEKVDLICKNYSTFLGTVE